MSRFQGRTLDLVWFTFLVMHIPTTALIDMQPLYPPALLAQTPLPAVVDWFVAQSRDPILGGVLRGGRDWDWLRQFFYLEGLFQLPCFVLGAIGLWINDKRVYPLLVMYGASTATTLLPVLQALLSGHHVSPPLTTAELGMLLSSYVPFLVIPLAMAVDMAVRLVGIVGVAERAERVEKGRKAQ